MISLTRYIELFRQPDLGGAIVASLIGRLPIGVAGLAILLLVQAHEGSYVEAGIVSAAYIAGLALASPILGRLIDRTGPRPVLIANAVLYPVWMLSLIAAEWVRAPLGWAMLLAALCGAALPPITTCMRTLYRQRLADDGLLLAALSLDSVLIEVVFIAGPMLVALLVGFVAPSAAMAFAAACAVLGVVLFLRAPAVAAWRISGPAAPSPHGALSAPWFRRLLLIAVGYATVFGLIEIGVTAFATSHGHPALAGVLLGVMSVGSAAGGLFYGGRTWHAPLQHQFAWSLTLMGAGIVPLALVDGFFAFAALSLVAGIAMAPPLIIQSLTIATTIQSGRMAEAFTWATTALLCGVGIGLAAGGWMLEHARPERVLGAAAAAAIVIGVAARLVARR